MCLLKSQGFLQRVRTCPAGQITLIILPLAHY